MNTETLKALKAKALANAHEGTYVDCGVVLYLIERLEQAEAENARLRAELAERSWRVIGPNFENLPQT